MREKWISIESEMSTRFLDKQEELHGLTLGALSGHHVLLMGPPGTAKSQMVKQFTTYLGGNYFGWLLTQYTTPDELFGPVDVRGLAEGHFQRIPTGKLPEADVAFIDEVFKANSAILNALLPVLQERVFYNNGHAVKIPLQFAVGASNELPNEDENLVALYDRFLLRYNPGYIQDAPTFRALLDLDWSWTPRVDPLDTAMYQADRAEVQKIVFTDESKEALSMLWEQARESGLVVSDRRWRHLMQVMQAESWVTGYAEVVPESLEVAQYILWNEPKQIRECKVLVRRCINTSSAKAEEVLEAASEAVASLNELSSIDEKLQVTKQIGFLKSELDTLRSNSTVEAAKVKLTALRNQIIENLTGGN